MKLTLISPKGVGMGTNEDNLLTKKIYSKLHGINSLEELMSCPNSPLLTIAAIAKPYCSEIEYIDEEIETIDFSRNFEMVGMSFMTQQASRAFELANCLRNRGAYLIAGGMHPTNAPEETQQYFDTVFIGEGERTIPEFFNDYRKETPKAVYLNNSVISMDEVPIPQYELLKFDKYKTIPVQISRGCPHNCEFCASTKVYGPKYRHKSVKRILEEIDIICKYKQHPHIYFTDDNMLVQPDFSLSLLKELKKRNIRWMTHTDIGVAEHEEILSVLFESGCRKLVIGFESIEPESLKMLEEWKYKKLKNYSRYIEKIQSYGVGIWGTFIVGLDSDEIDIFDKVIKFTVDNNLYGAMISVPTPFPGSQLHERLKKEGRILTEHWGSYTLWNVVVEPKNMTVEQLQKGFERVLTTIYSEENVCKRMEHFKNIYRQVGINI